MPRIIKPNTTLQFCFCNMVLDLNEKHRNGCAEYTFFDAMAKGAEKISVAKVIIDNSVPIG